MIGPRSLCKHLARAILIDRATPGDTSLIGTIARARSKENYRFASLLVFGKTVLDVGGGAGIGHDLLLGKGAVAIRSIDKHVAPTALHGDPRISSIQEDFLTYPIEDETVDVVICLGTIFYMRDVDAAVAKMHRALMPGGVLIMNCINQELVRRYFGLTLGEIDDKFSTAFDERGFLALLSKHFENTPECFIQQPVSTSTTLLGSIKFWFTPLAWPFRRHPVMPKPPGTEGMYVYAVVKKRRSWPLDAR